MFTNDWHRILSEEVQKDYFKNLTRKVYSLDVPYYPKKDEIFTAFNLTSYENTKVVVIGQDPYHGENQAHGLAFSVKNSTKIPPSLRNIYKEIEAEYLKKMPQKGELTNWAKQGVLLLNSTLTVEKDKANSHKDFGWSEFTDNVIRKLNQKATPVVFILWGNFAIKKQEFITNPLHLVLKSAHPSPLSASRGFFSNNHFKLTNDFLIAQNLTPIDWFNI